VILRAARFSGAFASRLAGRARGDCFRRGFAAYPSPRAKWRACSPTRGERAKTTVLWVYLVSCEAERAAGALQSPNVGAPG
jgi:hypothetical protein